MNTSQTKSAVNDLKKFASQFTTQEWQLLCNSKTFTEATLNNIVEAACRAADILNRPVSYPIAVRPVPDEKKLKLLKNSSAPRTSSLALRRRRFKM